MFDRFDVWQYREDNNCWDFVREFLLDRTSIPSEDIPKFGICPKDKRSINSAAKDLYGSFVETGPVNFSIACQYIGGILHHIGVVDGGYIRHHTGSVKYPLRDTVKQFESRGGTVKYFIHESLC